MRSEFEDQYDHVHFEGEERIRGEILKTPIRGLEPFAPICVTAETSVAEVIRRIVKSKGHTAACVVDDAGRLVGLLTERDVLTRVIGNSRAPESLPVGDVMTPDPEALGPMDTAAFALNRMATRGFRTIPVVDDAEKPIGILFTRHFVRFIVSLFRKATMNLPPDQELKHPDQIHGG